MTAILVHQKVKELIKGSPHPKNNGKCGLTMVYGRCNELVFMGINSWFINQQTLVIATVGL
jgi:hypothetical protein